MLHIVFQESDVLMLQEAMKLDEGLQGEIIEIKDEWGVGPLKDLDTDEGWSAREEWWRELLKGSPYGEGIAGTFDDRQTIKQLIEKLETDRELQAWIWLGQNQHDVTGYFWLIPQLKSLSGQIMILYLNNLPFINEKGQLFYPQYMRYYQRKRSKQKNLPARLRQANLKQIRMNGKNSVMRMRW